MENSAKGHIWQYDEQYRKDRGVLMRLHNGPALSPNYSLLQI